MTVNGFDPRGHSQVGDTGGVPQNALFGLGLLHEEALAALAVRRSRVRALFATVLLSTRARTAARRATCGREQLAGDESLRRLLLVGVGLIEMLDHLAP